MITALTAAKAYASAQSGSPLGGIGGGIGGIGGLGDNAAKPTGGFGDVLKSVMSDAVGASKKAEGMMAAQVQGKAELVDVVTALSSAQSSLETVMAVRDQVIAAYQEILRMPI
jgi:flagellar hook-basal body complex protein FliE